MAEKQADDLIDSVFRAARDVGYVLAGRQAPCAIHQHGDHRPDRPGSEDDLWHALANLRAGLGLRGDTPEDLVKSLERQGGPTWRREALAKVIKANALVHERNEQADRQAFDLIGEAVWAKQENDPDSAWEWEIKQVWPRGS